MPHEHDEHTDIATHYPKEHHHDDFATHYVEHVYFNNSSQSVIKLFGQNIDYVAPSVSESSFVIEWINLKRKYECIRPPLIDCYFHFSLRAPPALS